MDIESSLLLFHAIRDCGLYPADAVQAAEAVLAAGGDDAAIAERLYELGVLTSYQQRKLRIGRLSELLFGPFLVLDKIGEGGMGKVYRAYQLRVRRLVALKVVRPQLASNKTVLHRYKREAAAAAALDHPNIVKLYDADEVNGRYYLEMEFVDGIDLARMVKEFGKPPTIGLAQYSEACEYVRQAALGLQQAHDQRFVHRDIKPSNLLVSGHRALPGTDGKAVVRILDMGLVRSLSDDDEEFRADLTRDGTVVGTPDYMAPEQAKNSKTVDARADLYSLGCTLFFLLKGQPPFAEGSPIEKLLKHQVDPAPDLRKARPDVPAGVAAIVDRLLRKNPADRYQTATEVAHALAPFSGAVGLTFAPAASRSGRMPMPEAFSFTDEFVAPVVETPPTKAPAPPAAPAPSVRLRVVRPAGASGPPSSVSPLQVPAAPAPSPSRTVAVPRAVSAVPITRSDATPSSQSLPGAASRSTPKPAKAASETPPTPSAARPRPRKAPPPKKPTARKSKVVVIAVAVVALLTLVVAGVAIAIGSRTKGTPTPPLPGVGEKPVAKVEPAASKLTPIHDILPDRTTAVLVVYPKPYWQRLTYNPTGQDRTTEQLKALAERTRFDPRNFERGTLAFIGRTNQWVAIGEGPFLTVPWTEKLNELKSAKSSKHHGQKVYSFSPWSFGPYHAAVLGGRAYALSSDAEALGSLGSNMTAGKPTTLVPRELLDAVKIADPNVDPPSITFVAVGLWTLPDGTSLNEHGVVKATVTARLVGEEFVTEFAFIGRNRMKLRAFVNEFLATKLPDLHPGLKPITSLVAPLDPVFRETGDGHELVLSLKIPWTTVQECIEAMLTPAAGEPKK